MNRFPHLTDFACAHPGCGAIRGFRCTYSGYRFGHPIRRQRVIETIDRRIVKAKSATRKAVLAEYRAGFIAQAAELTDGQVAA